MVIICNNIGTKCQNSTDEVYTYDLATILPAVTAEPIWTNGVSGFSFVFKYFLLFA